MNEETGRPRTDDLEVALAAVTSGPRLGGLLLDLRHRAGRSLRELEAASGLAENVLAAMFTGRRFPDEAGLVAFLRACGVPETCAAPWLAALRAAIASGGNGPRMSTTLPFPPGTGLPENAGLSTTVVDGARPLHEAGDRTIEVPAIPHLAAQLRDQLRAELREQLRADLRDDLLAELRAQIRAEILEELRAGQAVAPDPGTRETPAASLETTVNDMAEPDSSAAPGSRP